MSPTSESPSSVGDPESSSQGQNTQPPSWAENEWPVTHTHGAFKSVFHKPLHFVFTSVLTSWGFHFEKIRSSELSLTCCCAGKDSGDGGEMLGLQEGLCEVIPDA